MSVCGVKRSKPRFHLLYIHTREALEHARNSEAVAARGACGAASLRPVPSVRASGARDGILVDGWTRFGRQRRAKCTRQARHGRARAPAALGRRRPLAATRGATACVPRPTEMPRRPPRARRAYAVRRPAPNTFGEQPKLFLGTICTRAAAAWRQSDFTAPLYFFSNYENAPF